MYICWISRVEDGIRTKQRFSRHEFWNPCESHGLVDRGNETWCSKRYF